MLLKLGNIFSEDAKDCGFYSTKHQGLFSKTHGRSGIGQSEPFDLQWMAQIRQKGGVKRTAGRNRASAVASWPYPAETSPELAISAI